MLLALRMHPYLISIVGAFICASSLAQAPVEAPDLLPSPEPQTEADSPLEREAGERVSIRLPPEHHPWCRFEPGAWRALRITTETFDSNGQSLGVSVSSETEKLGRVDEGRYLLESQSDVEVGGQSLSGPGRRHDLRILTDTSDAGVEAVQQPPAQINLDGRTIPCIVWRLTLNRSDRELVHEVYYNDSVWPYVLRREIVETSTEEGETPLSTIHESVVRTQVPVELEGRVVPAAHIHSLTETAGGRTERFEVHAAEVPGGFLSRSTIEWDSAGHRIRWSATELEDFGTQERKRRPLRRLLRRGSDR